MTTHISWERAATTKYKYNYIERFSVLPVVAFEVYGGGGEGSLWTETVESTALTFESIDHIHGSHRLTLGVFRVRDGITNNILQEDFQNTTNFLVDQPADAFHATSSSQTTNSWLGDT